MNKCIDRQLKSFMESKHQDLYLIQCQDNVHNLKALIIAPEDSVYQGGLFFYDIHLHDYPFQPPQVKLITINPERLHPDFYQSGLVRADFLGTYGSCEWTPLMKFEQMLLFFQSQFNSNPIQCEPEYKHVTIDDPMAKVYAIIVRYLTLVSTFQWLKCGHPEYDQIIKHYFCSHLILYQSSIESLRPYHGQTLFSIHHENITIDVDNLQSKYLQLQTQLTHQ